ncbi:MAG: DUF1552 domain-containing protein [Polyangiaceae bacterium]
MPVKPISRRHMLRGVVGGASVALAIPALEAMTVGTARAAPLPPIFGVFYWANGLPWHAGHGAEQAGQPDYWTPASTGSGYAGTQLLAPIMPFQPTLVTGLTPHTDVPPSPPAAPGQEDGHMRGFMVALTGDRIRPEGFDHPSHTLTALRPSLDQYVAKHEQFYGAQPALYNSLVLGASTARFHNYGHWNDISYNGPDSLNATILDPQQLYNMLFTSAADPAALGRRASLLDAVKDDAKSLAGKLGSKDKQRLAAHLENLDSIQKRLQFIGAACAAPAAPGATDDQLAKTGIMAELLGVALACGMTRAFSFMLDSPASTHVYSNVGANNDMHSTCHAGSWQNVYDITNYHMQCLAEFLGKLEAHVDPNGDSLLDRSLVFGVSEYGEGFKHGVAEMPCLMLGGCNGHIKRGVHVRDPGGNYSKAHVTMLRAVGIDTPTFGFNGGETSEDFGDILA